MSSPVAMKVSCIHPNAPVMVAGCRCTRGSLSAPGEELTQDDRFVRSEVKQHGCSDVSDDLEKCANASESASDEEVMMGCQIDRFYTRAGIARYRGSVKVRVVGREVLSRYEQCFRLLHE